MTAEIVTGAQGGLQKVDVGTSEVAFKVTAWKNRYIKITVSGSQLKYVFSTDVALVIDDTTEELDAETPLDDIPDTLEDGASVHEEVPDVPVGSADEMYVIVKAAAADTTVRIRPSEAP